LCFTDGLFRLADRDVDATHVQILVAEVTQHLEVVDTISRNSERITQRLQGNEVVPPAVGRPQTIHPQPDQSAVEDCMVCLLESRFWVIGFVPSVLQSAVNRLQKSLDLSRCLGLSPQVIAK